MKYCYDMKIREIELGDEADIIRLCSEISIAEGHENDVDLTLDDYKQYLSQDMSDLSDVSL